MGKSVLLDSGTGRTGEGFGSERGRGYALGASWRADGFDLAATWFAVAKRGIPTNDAVDPGFKQSSCHPMRIWPGASRPMRASVRTRR